MIIFYEPGGSSTRNQLCIFISLCFFLCISQDHHFSIVGGWTNPVEKYVRQIGSCLQASGWKHHLVSWPSKVSSSQLDGWKSMDPEPLKILHDANVVVRDKIDGHALSTWKLRWLLVSFFGGTKPFSIVKSTVGYCWYLDIEQLQWCECLQFCNCGLEDLISAEMVSILEARLDLILYGHGIHTWHSHGLLTCIRIHNDTRILYTSPNTAQPLIKVQSPWEKIILQPSGAWGLAPNRPLRPILCR